MSHDNPRPGTIGWIDLTVPNTGIVRDFYKAVVGWETSDVDMDGYNDYCMHPTADEEPVAGICHARGTNSDLPPHWLIYIHVADLDQSIRECLSRGGAVVSGPRPSGDGRFCVIRDPAGAVAALYQAD